MRAFYGMRPAVWMLLVAALLALAGCFGEEDGDPESGGPESACEVTGSAGVGVLSAESVGIILNNLISETSPGEPKSSAEVKMGDGVALMADGWGEVRKNTLHGNSRAAVIAHACDHTTVITENQTTDNVYGVVVQGTDLQTKPSANDSDGGYTGSGGTEPPGPQELPDDPLDVNQNDVETL